MFLQCYEYLYAASFPFIFSLAWILCVNNKRKIMQISILHSIWIQATKHVEKMRRYAEREEKEKKRYRSNTTFIRLKEVVLFLLLLTRISIRWIDQYWDQYRIQCIQNKLVEYLCAHFICTSWHAFEILKHLECALALYFALYLKKSIDIQQACFSWFLCWQKRQITDVHKVLMNETRFHCKMLALHLMVHNILDSMYTCIQTFILPVKFFFWS